MKVLVTGGAGYLGSVLSGVLLNHQHEVHVLDRLSYGIEPLSSYLKNPDFTITRGDKGDPDAVKTCIADVDAVIDLAAVVGEYACENNPTECRETNVLATQRLYDAAVRAGVQKLLFASTCSVYGIGNSQPLDESHVTRPQSLYAKSKKDAEDALLSAERETDVVVLRFATLCGPSPRMRFDLVVNLMTAMAVAEGQVIVEGGQQWRPLLDVRDAATAVQHILENDLKHRVYNIGTNLQNMRLIELGELIARSVPGTSLVQTNGRDEERSYRVDFHRLAEAGFSAQIPLEDSIEQVGQLVDAGQIGDFRSPEYRNL